MKTRSSRVIKTVLIVALAIIFFLIISRTALMQNFTSGLVAGGSWFKKIVTTPFATAQLRKELESLRAEENQLVQENARLLELREENEKLRKELNFYESTRYPVATVRVIGRVRENNVLFLVLNGGTADQIKIGQPVVVDGVLVGKIVKVQESSSVMIPLTATTTKTAATFAGSEKTSGIIEGELNLNLKMDLIPKDVEVSNGATVITSGLEEYIPRGLVIGTVEYVESNLEDLFQVAYLNAPMRSEEIRIASVITALLVE